MKAIFEQFGQAVMRLTFRLLPSEGATPWAMSFGPNAYDDEYSLPKSSYKPKGQNVLMESFSKEEMDEAISELDDDLENIDEIFSDTEMEEMEDAEDSADSEDSSEISFDDEGDYAESVALGEDVDDETYDNDELDEMGDWAEVG